MSPTFVPIGNYCPIIFIKGEADREYRTRGLAPTTTTLQSPYELYSIVQGMYYMVWYNILHNMVQCIELYNILYGIV
jgi:hypothetical protein